ncbi:hypothetical protein OESDEN_13673 [Oesophagostomum dentatum]|uniref:Uncharacterized protein n=1 Tax=Oesophagostomum dentatum TaxID=61180 RepID=A0A0B1STP6_OESDE|nr:hypothetical protein OESDEN_13673 [Oesophagostomum dentatum]
MDSNGDLSTAVPSCSRPNVTLDHDVLTMIFEKVATIGNIRDVMNMRRVSTWAAYGIDRSLARSTQIRVDIRAPIEFRISGLKKERLPVPEPVIFIQGSRVTPKAANRLMAFLIGKMRTVKDVSLNIEDADLTVFNSLLDQLIKAENVKLEIHLERLSLMTFDLGFEASHSDICEHMLAIARSGTTFKHLSYTSFIGFDPTDDVVQLTAFLNSKSGLNKCGSDAE